jgi:AcrR family transcriptional regulator
VSLLAHRTRRTPRQARSRDKVRRIVEAAKRVLMEEGTAAFNTNRVAKEAGVGIGSLYEYFPNKQSIVDRLIEETAASESAAILERLEQVADLAPHDVLRPIIELLFDLYVQNHELYRVLFALSDDPRDVGHRPGEQRIIDEVRKRIEIIAEPLGIDDPDLASFTLFHAVESLCDRMAGQGLQRFTREQCIDEIVKVAQGYLGLR